MSSLLDQQPRLGPSARLRFDRHSESYVLLSPERGLRLNGSAAEVVRRCTGALTVQEILVELQPLTPQQSSEDLASDVLSLLVALEQRRLIVFERSS